MPAIQADPAAAREFAQVVVQRLREAGHQALWAGGCVRDELLGRTPADYDVATSARPVEVREIFGKRRTLAVGAAFGVITVVGPKGAGQVEVTTFRTDEAYTDGRHPAGVTFCSAEEDAKRRDFTINGLFLDPATGKVFDYVGGREDLVRGVVRAIGVPSLRFGEDHLRMLRAVRFAAVFGFVLDAATREAVERLCHFVRTVSPERVAAELRLMVSRNGRRRALELLSQTGLAREVLPEVSPGGDGPMTDEGWRQASAIIDALDEPDLPMAIATLVEREGERGEAAHKLVLAIARRLRLSNAEAKLAGWLCAGVASLEEGGMGGIENRPWSTLQPWLAHDDAFRLADLLRARADLGFGRTETAAWVTRQLERPRHELDPPPLLSGDDLLAMGLAEGKLVGGLLKSLRQRQLDGELSSRDAAIAFVRTQMG
jgi:tRNA nucleotidyltransferase/poly(A) polymerase